MIVYRIEHRGTGQGPYNPGEITREERARLDEARYEFGVSSYDAPAHQPSPEKDGIGPVEEGEFFFACASIDDLVSWFGEGFAEAVSEAGFVVTRYYTRLRDARIGRRQVAFIRDEARRLGTVPASSLLPLRKAIA